MKKSRTSIIHRQQTKNAVLSLCAVFYWRVQSAVNLNNKMTILLNNEYMQNNKKLKYLSYLVEISAPEPQRTASAHQGCMPLPSSLHRIASCHL